MRYAVALLCALMALAMPAAAHHDTNIDERLPVIGPAPDFTLIDQDGAPLALQDLRGKVVALTFIYATCTDTCPVVTAKMISLQTQLGRDFGPRIRFISITVDPTVDTPAVLRAYASAHGADRAGWSFLTGPQSSIDRVVRDYGAFARKTERDGVEHLFLTSLIDIRGRLRVQYLGYRFKPSDMLHDLRTLLRE